MQNRRQTKCYKCLVLGKTQYFLFFLQFLLKGNGIITSSGKKQHGTVSLSLYSLTSMFLLSYSLLTNGGNHFPHVPSWNFVRTLPLSSSSLTLHIWSDTKCCCHPFPPAPLPLLPFLVFALPLWFPNGGARNDLLTCRKKILEHLYIFIFYP